MRACDPTATEKDHGMSMYYTANDRNWWYWVADFPGGGGGVNLMINSIVMLVIIISIKIYVAPHLPH